MAQDHVAEPLARRRRESVRDARRYYAGMFVLGLVILAATVAPTVWGWWQTAVPAAIGTAIFIFVLITIVGSLPMHSRAYVWPYFDCDPGRIPHPGERFGRALFRFSGVLDGWAREAGVSVRSQSRQDSGWVALISAPSGRAAGRAGRPAG